ncbi:MAG TPA: CoA-transferase [bacterium]|nr:CoA-transferase [bacterium]
MEVAACGYSTAELMAVVLSRELRDGEFGALGAASQIPMAAVKLAKLTHAPNLSWLCGGSGAINSKLPTLLQSAADYRNLFGAEYRTSMEDVVDMEMRGRVHFACLGGMQIDQYGNSNMVCVGDYHNPTVRGPGTVGLIFTAAFGRVYIYLHHHNPQILVEKVDFISGPGFYDGSRMRDEFVNKNAKGPCMVLTPLAVFDFDEISRKMRLCSVHPGCTVEQVLAKTGFRPLLKEPITQTQAPTEEELALLRTQVDPEGVLRQLIP